MIALWIVMGIVIAALFAAAYSVWKENKRARELENSYNTLLVNPEDISLEDGITMPSGQVMEIDDPMSVVPQSSDRDDLAGIVGILVAQTVMDSPEGDIPPSETTVNLSPNEEAMWLHKEDAPEPSSASPESAREPVWSHVEAQEESAPVITPEPDYSRSDDYHSTADYSSSSADYSSSSSDYSSSDSSSDCGSSSGGD
jgi:hypothetical protein